MTSTVWKYQIRQDVTEMWVPVGAEPLHVDVQDSVPTLWMRVDPQAHRTPVTVKIVGTGQPAPNVGEADYVGTFFLAGKTLVFHVFIDGLQNG